MPTLVQVQAAVAAAFPARGVEVVRHLDNDRSPVYYLTGPEVDLIASPERGFHNGRAHISYALTAPLASWIEAVGAIVDRIDDAYAARAFEAVHSFGYHGNYIPEGECGCRMKQHKRGQWFELPDGGIPRHPYREGYALCPTCKAEHEARTVAEFLTRFEITSFVQSLDHVEHFAEMLLGDIRRLIADYKERPLPRSINATPAAATAEQLIGLVTGFANNCGLAALAKPAHRAEREGEAFTAERKATAG